MMPSNHYCPPVGHHCSDLYYQRLILSVVELHLNGTTQSALFCACLHVFFWIHPCSLYQIFILISV